MDKVLAPMMTSISEFRSDMSGTLKRAGSQPFAVLNNNKPSFYVLTPEQYALVAEILYDLELAPLIEQRALAARDNAVTVDIADL